MTRGTLLSTLTIPLALLSGLLLVPSPTFGEEYYFVEKAEAEGAGWAAVAPCYPGTPWGYACDIAGAQHLHAGAQWRSFCGITYPWNGCNSDRFYHTPQVPCDEEQETYDLVTQQCVPAIQPEKQPPACPGEANPVNPLTGNKYQREVDYRGAGPFPLRFRRHYNSYPPLAPGRQGRWQHNYEMFVSVDPDKPYAARVYREDGRAYTFYHSPRGWEGEPDVSDRLSKLSDESGQRTGWAYRTGDEILEIFDAEGKLVSLTDRRGLIQTLDYTLATSEGGDGDPATLDRVVGPFGRRLTFGYDAAGRIATMTDPADGLYAYRYDAAGNLSSVTYPDETPAEDADNPARTYHYEDPRFPRALTAIGDENGNRFAT